MKLYEIKNKLKTKSIYDIPLRVTYYARVSSDSDEFRKLSSRVKFEHKQAIKSGVVLGNSNIFGYRKQDSPVLQST